MKDRTALYISLLILSLSMLSFQWPVRQGRLTATYGESRWDHFHDGIDIVCPDDKIYPIEASKLVYFWDRSVFPLENYPGGGNYKVLAGARDYAIFMHMEDGFSKNPVYGTGDQVGIIGNTGHSFAKHLHLTYLSLDKKSTANPLTLFPGYTDTIAPSISDIYFKIDDKYMKISNNASIRLTKNYPILLKIVDTVTGNEKLGIFTLKAWFNNKEVLNVNFKTLVNSPEGLRACGKRYDDLYDEEGYYKINGITFVDGENHLKVKAEDFAGNGTEKSFMMTVKLDIK